MRLLCNQQSLDAGEALILRKVLDGLQYLCRSWWERIRQGLWPRGNPLAGPPSSPTGALEVSRSRGRPHVPVL